jgi:hypothetical protein
MSLTVATLAAAEPWVTPTYCSACHANRHPGCGCSCHRTSAAAFDHWLAALKYYGTGRTAGDLRAEAADPAWVAGLAYIDGIAPGEERARMLGTARAVEELAAAGLSPEQAYFLAGLDRDLGPYDDNAALSAAYEAPDMRNPLRAVRRPLAAPWQSLLTWMARGALEDGCTPEVIRAGQGAGPFLSEALARRMAEAGGGS